MFSVFSARENHFRRLYSLVEYVTKEDVSTFQKAAGLPPVPDEETIAESLQQVFVLSLGHGAEDEEDMSVGETLQAADQISSAAKDLLEALGCPNDPAAYVGDPDSLTETYDGLPARMLPLGMVINMQYAHHSAGLPLQSGATSASPVDGSATLAITAAAIQQLDRRIGWEEFLKARGVSSENAGSLYAWASELVAMAPPLVALILSISNDMLKSPDVYVASTNTKPNFERSFTRAFFLNATHVYGQMFGERARPQTADKERKPNGPATRWVGRVIRTGARSFSAAMPCLLGKVAPEDHRWVERAKTALENMDDLSLGVKAGHVDEAWQILKTRPDFRMR